MSLQLFLSKTVLTLVILAHSEGSGSKCQDEIGFVLSIDSTKSDGGEWVTAFTAIRNTSDSPVNAGLDLTQVVTECDGNHMVKIQGVMKGKLPEKGQKLIFNKKCSPNAAITNKGRTLQKLKPEEAAAVTNRPLFDNEIFTVRIDKKGQNPNHAFGIGVTTLVPSDVNALPNHMNTLKSGAWMFYHTHLYHKTEAVFVNYLKFNLKDLKEGDRIGVMRSESDALHFFLNGEDQGPAASNIPGVVYGAFELFGQAIQGTIVDS